MNKEDFFELSWLLEPIIRPKGNSPNYRQLTTEKKLAIMLYYGKGTSSLRMTTNTFEVHQCTVSSFFSKSSSVRGDWLFSAILNFIFIWIFLPSMLKFKIDYIENFTLFCRDENFSPPINRLAEILARHAGLKSLSYSQF